MPQLCSMSVHRGQKLREILEDKGVSITFVAKRMEKKSPRIFYYWFDQPELPYSTLRRIGEIIGYDFSKDFPEMRNKAKMAQEAGVKYGRPENFVDCVALYDNLLAKYVELLEENKALAEENYLLKNP